MPVSEHVKAAHAELIKQLDLARVLIARSRSRVTRVNQAFCEACDRFVAVIKMESGNDEVKRRGYLIRKITREGSGYYKAADAVYQSGLVWNISNWSVSTNPHPPKTPNAKWNFQPLPIPSFARWTWETAQKAIEEKRRSFSPEQMTAVEDLAEECDALVKLAERLQCDGCLAMMSRSKELKRFQSGEIDPKHRWDFGVGYQSNRERSPSALTRKQVRDIRNAAHSLRRWIAKKSNRPALNAKQRKALDIIKTKGPIKGVSIARQIGIEESTLRTHYLPLLRKHGVKNDGDGYYLEDG